MATKHIVPWPDADLASRETVFAALVQRGVKRVVARVISELRSAPLTAAKVVPTTPPVTMEKMEEAVKATWSIFVESELVPAATEVFATGGELTLAGIEDATGDFFDPMTDDSAAEYLSVATNRMVNISETIWKGIRDELLAGYAAGESIPEIAARLTKFPQVNAYRSVVVARTEVVSAANAGAYIQMLETGLDAQKEWISTDDPRTRESHRHAEGQTVDLTEEFTVGIYTDGVKTGEEGMEFPGDPTASAGNVIQCRCTLGFAFSEEDDVLTADAFIEAEHPRANDGKFAKKAGTGLLVILPNFDKLTDNQMASFVKGIHTSNWDKYSQEQKDSIIKRAAKIPGEKGDAATNKLFLLFTQDKKNKLQANADLNKPTPTTPNANSGPAAILGGKDKKTGKKAAPGKPVYLRVKAVFETDYEDGAIVAVKKGSNERIVWNGQTKKMERQKKVGSDWETTESLTRGALMAKYKNEEGWTTPTASDGEPTTAQMDVLNNILADVQADQPPVFNPQETPPASAPSAAGGGKPIMLRTKVLFGTKYEPGDVVAFKAGADGTEERLIWNGKKMERQGRDFDNNWQTTETLTRGAVYQKYKDEEGWTAPVAASPDKGEAEIVPPAASEDVLPGQDADGNGVITSTEETVDFEPVSAPEPAPPIVVKEMKEVSPSLLPTGPIPTAEQLTFTGKVVGTHNGKIFKDPQGGEWLFKAAPKAFADVDVITANLHERVGLFTPATGTMRINGEYGSIQRLIKSTEPFGHKFDPAALSFKDTVAIQKEQVFDWLVANHDAHAKNLLKDTEGNIFGIDKGQSFKWFGGDKLDWNFQPNEHPQAANTLWKAFAEGAPGVAVINPQDSELRSFIENIQNIPDAEYREAIRPYAEGIAGKGLLGKGGPAYLGISSPGFPANDVEAFLDAAVARKNNLLKDFDALFKKASAARQAKLGVPGPPPPPVVALAPVPGIKPKSVPLNFTTDMLTGKTSTGYQHLQVIAEKPAQEGLPAQRLIWNAKSKKFIRQYQADSGNNTNSWYNANVYTKTAAHSVFKGAAGWFTPTSTQDSSGGATPGSAAVPTIANPVATPKPKPVAKPKVPKFDVATLQAQSDLHGLTIQAQEALYASFRNHDGKFIRTSSPSPLIFKALATAVDKHNKLNPTSQITMLGAVRAIDTRASKNAGQNLHLFETKVVDWLGTPSGKTTATKFLADLALTPEQKAQANQAKVSTKLGAFNEIKISQPDKGPFNGNANFLSKTPSQALEMQKKMGDWTSAERASLRHYTGNNFTEINGQLRGKYPPTPSVMAHAANMQRGMKPLPEGVILYRGTGPTAALPGNIEAYKDLIGGTFVDHGFFSTSIGPRSGQIKLTIEAPKGTPAAYVQNISHYPNELEMLLGAGLRYEILSAKEENSGWNSVIAVRVRVVPNE